MAVHRGGRGRADGKQKRAKQIKVTEERPTVRLPIVGDVPLMQRADGVWTYDPAYRPPLPPGAVAGNITRQVYCCDPPRYAYVDDHRICVQCGDRFVFRATEQKYWYETLQFRLDSHAIRCVACRRRRRTVRAVQARYQAATRRNDTDDPGELVEYASALAEFIERTGSGNPEEVIAAARKAARAADAWADPLYWEGRGQELAGREAKARASYEAFVARASTSPSARRLVADARRRLSAPVPGDRPATHTTS